MKNKFILIFVLLIITICIVGCNNSNKLNIGGKSKIVDNINTDVLLTIDDKSLTNTGVTLKLINNNEQSLRYGPDYSIEIKEKNEWHVINVETAFNAILYSLQKGDTVEYEIDWSPFYGKLPKGEYRLIKYFYFEDKEHKTSDNFPIFVEFVI